MADKPGGVWSDRLLGLTALLSSVFVAALVLLGSYVPKYRGSTLFFSADGWCAGYEPLGDHCFGDFGLPLIKAQEQNPWDPASDLAFPYHAGLMWIFRGFALISETLSPTLALALYMILLLAALLTPAVWAIKALGWSRGGVAAGFLVVLTYPFLLTLDRGSSLGFAVPALLLVAASFLARRPGLLLVAILFATVVRPQYAILLLLLPLVARWLWLLYGALSSAVIFIVPFVLWSPSNSAALLRDFSSQVASFSRYQPLEDAFPSNYSASRLATLFAQALNWIAESVVGSAPLIDTSSPWVGLAPGLVTIALGAAAVLLAGARLPRVVVLSIPMSLTLLVPSVSYGYYTVFATVLGVFVVISSTLIQDDPQWRVSHSGVGMRWLFVAVLAVTLAPGFIPLPATLGYGNGYPSLVAFGWLVLIALSLFHLLALRKGPSSMKGLNLNQST